MSTSTARLGVLRETKAGERRVAVVPDDAAVLHEAGADVLVEAGAGERAGFADAAYLHAGARIATSAQDVIRLSDVVVKVKEPVITEIEHLRAGQLFMSFLHLAACPELVPPLLKSGATVLGFETIAEAGRHPVLQPMSEVAGTLSLQIGEHYLEATNGGRGTLLPGVGGGDVGKVVIVGSGVVGEACGRLAHAVGARVTFVDRNAGRLQQLASAYAGAMCVPPEPEVLESELEHADLLIGAVYINGARAPRVVTRRMVGRMPQRAVAVDVAIDQGGCLETARPTTHDAPVYEDMGVLHYCVTNIPSMVPRSASGALSGALLPYLSVIARDGVTRALQNSESLARAVNIAAGRVILQELAPALTGR
ncbi:MAG: alanine dehydrogenase [Dehalococcoidia bacterium]